MTLETQIDQVTTNIATVRRNIESERQVIIDQTERRRTALLALDDATAVDAERKSADAKAAITRGEEQLELLQAQKRELEDELRREQQAAESQRLQNIYDALLLPKLQEYEAAAAAVAAIATQICAVDAYLRRHHGPDFQSLMRRRVIPGAAAVFENRVVPIARAGVFDGNGREIGEHRASAPQTTIDRVMTSEPRAAQTLELRPFAEDLTLPPVALDAPAIWGDEQRTDAEERADQIVQALLQPAPKKPAKAA
jgi:hypothetical protein